LGAWRAGPFCKSREGETVLKARTHGKEKIWGAQKEVSSRNKKEEDNKIHGDLKREPEEEEKEPGSPLPLGPRNREKNFGILLRHHKHSRLKEDKTASS